MMSFLGELLLHRCARKCFNQHTFQFPGPGNRTFAHPPLLRLILLSNHKLVIAKAKADCDSPHAERRPPAARPPAVHRVPGPDEFANFRKLNWLFPRTLNWLFVDT